jgi:small subunit ribosomal protein S21
LTIIAARSIAAALGRAGKTRKNRGGRAKTAPKWLDTSGVPRVNSYWNADSVQVSFTISPTKGGRVVKLNVRDRESIQEAVRRFRKLVERSGIKKEMRRREYYEKPSETRRRARLRAARRGRASMLEGL